MVRFYWLVCMAGIILLAVVWIRFHTAVVACKKSDDLIIPDGKTIAAEYIRKGTFVIDLLSLVPFFVQVWSTSPRQISSGRAEI